MNKKMILIFFIILLIGLLCKLLSASFISKQYFNKGYSYYKQKDYVKSFYYLKKAHKLNSKNIDYRYYYVESLIHLSPSISVQKEVFEIANGEKNDSAQLTAEKQVRKWRLNAMINAGDNYIEQVPLDIGILRWDTSKFPLKISVIAEKNLKIPAYYKTEVEKAFSQWQSSVDIIKFTIDDNKPDIIVKFTQTPDNICDKNECLYVSGYTKPNIQGKILKNMVITLYANDPLGNYMSDKELYNVALHEIGHALGIMGHSYSTGDLMYQTIHNKKDIYSQYKSSFQYISSKDINTIKLLYKIMPDITNSNEIDSKGLIYAPIIFGTSKNINEKKLKEALNYVKNAPEISGGYIDLGIAYANLNKHKEAIIALKKAYNLAKTNKDKYDSMYNLSVLYFNINDYENALKHAKIAQNINDNDDIRELIININLEKSK